MVQQTSLSMLPMHSKPPTFKDEAFFRMSCLRQIRLGGDSRPELMCENMVIKILSRNMISSAESISFQMVQHFL